MTLKSEAKLKKNWFFLSKMTITWWILRQSLKNLHFDYFLLCKLFNVWPKKLQRSHLSWHWKVKQNLKKNWLVVWKMTWGIWQIFTKALESVKVRTWLWWGSFVQSRKCMSLKFTEKSCVMTMKNDTKLKEELTYHFKIEWEIWQILTRVLESLQNLKLKWAPSDQRI